MFRKSTPAVLAATLTLLAIGSLAAQYRPTPPSSVLLHELQKLQNVSSALYVAAHPDDENTRLIAYLANGEKAETAYLSLTRGDGGQNLIGTDIREGLGVIRTQELLAARRIDGGKQFFSRANDFGYSKHPDETLNFWDRDSILSDMVWIIRKWQPDVIVTRFDPESAGRTHGHHTTSAMLAMEAYDLAGDAEAFPEQLRQPGISTWTPKRMFFNTSWWFYGSREAFAAADKSDLVEVDAGAYYPLLGLSTGEIAARSRSQHASQGFGSSASRGSSVEYLKHLKGSFPDDRSDLFGGVEQGWSRFTGGAAVERVLAKAEADFSANDPAAIVPQLLEAARLIEAMPANRYTRSKLPVLHQLIADCLGVYFEATASDSLVTTGEQVKVEYELIQRHGGEQVHAKSLSIDGTDLALESPLAANEAMEGEITVAFGTRSSSPYWLSGASTLGMYSAPGYDIRGDGENAPAMTAKAHLEVGGRSLRLSVPVTYRITYPDKGEVYRPVLAVPALGGGFTEPVYLWPNAEAREVEVVVENFGNTAVDREIELQAPQGWTVTPKVARVELPVAGSKQRVRFSVSPGGNAEGTLRLRQRVDGAWRDLPEVKILRYAHIPQQVMIGAAESKAVRLDLKRSGKRIGYIMGAGDLVPKALNEVGYEVDMLTETDLAERDLSGYDAIVVGIRAYNAQDWLPRVNDKLLAYAKTGGTVVVQYNTSRRLDMAKYAPYPLKLSRKRVTVEEAPITFIDPDAEVLNEPNKLTAADFDGWVQERGLYFPEEWDEAYAPILESNDPGEEPLQGSLLVAEYGEGHYVYTGLSFFRELPAGVPGAYRLFVNLLEL